MILPQKHLIVLNSCLDSLNFPSGRGENPLANPRGRSGISTTMIWNYTQGLFKSLERESGRINEYNEKSPAGSALVGLTHFSVIF